MADPNSPDGPNGIYVLPEADITHVSAKHLDLAYADSSPFQTLDLYLPDGTAPEGGWPTVIYVHGGAWMMCDKRDIQLVAPLSMRDHGYAVASVNYRLTSEASFPAQIFDVKAAIRMLRARAGDLGLDPASFALWGGSAGGHLVLLAGMTDGVPIMEDPAMGHAGVSTQVNAVVAFYPPTRLDAMDSYLGQTGAGDTDHLDPQSPESRLLGGVPTDVPGQVIAANPETWVTPQCPPVILFHAPADPIVPVQHSVFFADRVTQIAGQGRATLRLVQNAGHATPEFDTPAILAEAAAFLKTHLA